MCSFESGASRETIGPAQGVGTVSFAEVGDSAASGRMQVVKNADTDLVLQ